MQQEDKNYTPAKADRRLPIPAVCQWKQGAKGVKIGDRNERIPVACDEALICQRCQKCAYHCECSGGLLQTPTQPVRRKKGPDPNQPSLCEKP